MTKLYEDALKLTIDENLRNLTTLLDWASRTSDMTEKIQHVDQAHMLLGEVVKNLRELQNK